MDVNAHRCGVLYAVTSALALNYLRGQLQYLHDKGFDVTVISSGGDLLDEAARIEGVKAIEIPMAKKPAPRKDLVSLWRLWRIMRALRPAVTNVGTPKAGLLGGLAAWLNRVPCRFYTLRGLRFETTKGLKRRLLICAERLACHFAHRVICVSKSVQAMAVASGLVNWEKTVVFGRGSSNGVGVSRFAPTRERISRADELRRELRIPPSAPVMGFVGRLTHDKGVPELLEAFLRLRDQFPDLRLLLLGRFESEDSLPVETRQCLETHPQVVLLEHQQRDGKPSLADQSREDWPVEDAAPYYSLMDVFVLPSHREGLPNVILEAQAACKPVAAARATGIVDVVAHEETGLLFPVGDIEALTDAVARLLSDKVLARKLACAGEEQVKGEFRQEQIWEALYQEYQRILRTRELSLPAIPSLKTSSHSQNPVSYL
jgi:glycosyltransferase involved in cell wall biosynthesis